MTLTDTQKQTILDEFNNFKDAEFEGKSKKEKQALGQFFTPPELSIRMIEKFDSITDKTILDPACGNGNLLAAMIIAGADPKKVYGNELDPNMVASCQQRLMKLGVPETNIHIGNALEAAAYDF